MNGPWGKRGQAWRRWGGMVCTEGSVGCSLGWQAIKSSANAAFLAAMGATSRGFVKIGRCWRDLGGVLVGSWWGLGVDLVEWPKIRV